MKKNMLKPGGIRGKQGTLAGAGNTRAAKSLPRQDPLKEFQERPSRLQLTSTSLVEGSDPRGSSLTSLLASQMNSIWPPGRAGETLAVLPPLALSMEYLGLLGQGLCSRPIRATVITPVPD